MIKQINSQKTTRSNSRADRKKASESKVSLPVSQTRAKEKAFEQNGQARFDDSAEMFRGLFTGDEHYHSRGLALAPL